MPVHSRYKELTFTTKINWDILKISCIKLQKTVARTSDTSMSSFRNVESTLYRQRDTMIPKIPRKIESLRIRDEWAETQERIFFQQKNELKLKRNQKSNCEKLNFSVNKLFLKKKQTKNYQDLYKSIHYVHDS